MGRHRIRIPLNVFLNNHLVGTLTKETSGGISFKYDPHWQQWENAIPVSLSMPLTESIYTGPKVVAVFENLLPDSEVLRRYVAEKVKARGIDAHSLLAVIGRDCVGALQFIPDGQEITTSSEIQGIAISDEEIEQTLLNLTKTPLGLRSDNDFRISIAGVQEKTALLYYKEQWLRPIGTTPTTHIFKTQIGHLPQGIDLSNSVENEFYCLKLMKAFGFPVNEAHIQVFGETKALVIKRFDRLWTRDSRLIRLPQEDCCQALSVPPSLKYQDHGGPGIIDILNLLSGSDEPLHDQLLFLKSQIFFWLIGATDGHGKNFSVFLRPGGGYKLTPFYDVLSAQPSVDARQIESKQMRMAMSVGLSRHYKFNEIAGRHFIQLGEKSGLATTIIETAITDMVEKIIPAFNTMENILPHDFPEAIHYSIKIAANKRKPLLENVLT